jgi:uncharacterized protein (TIGR03067 family)
MNYLLLSVVLAISPMQAQAQPGKDNEGKRQDQKIDGEWTTVHVEIDGKRVENKQFTKVNIKNNVVTCQHDGKEKSWKLSFGPHNMIQATEVTTSGAATDPSGKGSQTHFGVYIASNDYFCVCMNKGMDRRPGIGNLPAKGDLPRPGAQPVQPGAGIRFEGHQPHSSDLVIILRRSGVAAD